MVGQAGRQRVMGRRVFLAGTMLLAAVMVLVWPHSGWGVPEERLGTALESEVLPFFLHSVQSGFIKGRNGVPLYYAKREVSEERGALIIVGGRTEFVLKYAELLYDLKDSGFSIYLLDHRGQGLSGRMLTDSHKGHVEDFSEYVADFSLFVEMVVNARDHRKRIILAHSMGGTIASLYASAHPSAVDGLVLCAPMMQIKTGRVPSLVATGLVWLLDALGKGDDYAPGTGSYDPSLPDADSLLTHSLARLGMTRTLLASDPRLALGGPTNHWVGEALRGTESVRELADRIIAPILLLQAEEDKVVGAEGQDIFCARAADCTREVVPGAAHELLMERDGLRDLVVDRIMAFLDSCAPSVQ